MALNCSAALIATTAALNELNASFLDLKVCVERDAHRLATLTQTLSSDRQVLYDEASQTEQEPDPCVSESPKDYTLSLHIGAIFVILVASALGTVIPLIGSHRSKLAVPPFVIVLGKCMGTGVILACGLIHMLLVGLTMWASFLAYRTCRMLFCSPQTSPLRARAFQKGSQKTIPRMLIW